MQLRSWFFIVGLFSIFALMLSVTAVAAISNVSVTYPGTYIYFSTDTCSDGNSGLDASIHLTGTTDDGGGYDWFAFITYDGSGNVIDANNDRITTGTTDTILDPIIPGIGSLSNPVSRPFTTIVYDVPSNFSGPLQTLTGVNWILANGTQMASTTFDPSFDPACGKLPWATGVCPVLPDGSVVGDLPNQTQAFYAPGKVSPGVFINPGTYWVIGEDASGQYYEIMLSCQFLWVPIDTMQPSYQAPWSGQPLPTRVVS